MSTSLRLLPQTCFPGVKSTFFSFLWLQYDRKYLVAEFAVLHRFVSIAAGRDHLLALTSSGRTFAHPINKNANTHGQLGFRKFDVADPSSSTSLSRLHVELTPKSAVDPYANKARYNRQTRGNQWFEAAPAGSEDGAPSTPATSLPRDVLLPVSENLVGVDDVPIRFCDKLFEVPSLKGVKIDQIAAGARSSYAKTDSGRVLGWGANEYGYVIFALFHVTILSNCVLTVVV